MKTVCSYCGEELYKYAKRCPFCLSLQKRGEDPKVVTKNDLRNRVIGMRDSLPPAEVLQRGDIIIDRLFGMEQFAKCNVILCYVDMRNEVPTRVLLRRLIGEGRSVCVPAIVKDCPEDRKMRACEIRDIDKDLKAGTFGIYEPADCICGGDCSLRVYLPGELDAVIVPGIAFDRKRRRIGYGAGYFDRYLSNVRSDCMKIGLAYEFQVLENVPSEGHDIALDMIITEDEIII